MKRASCSAVKQAMYSKVKRAMNSAVKQSMYSAVKQALYSAAKQPVYSAVKWKKNTFKRSCCIEKSQPAKMLSAFMTISQTQTQK